MTDDGRPCNTDKFLAVLLETCDDHFDIHDAIRNWVEGDWNTALEFIDDDPETAMRMVSK